jgi:hypothetical protein
MTMSKTGADMRYKKDIATLLSPGNQAPGSDKSTRAHTQSTVTTPI